MMISNLQECHQAGENELEGLELKKTEIKWEVRSEGEDEADYTDLEAGQGEGFWIGL